MRSRARSGAKLTFHPIVIASAIVFTVLFLALGYHTGVNQVERAHQPLLQGLRKEIDEKRANLSACNAKRNELFVKVGKSDSRVRHLQSSLRDHLAEQNQTQTLFAELEAQETRCSIEQAELVQRQRSLSLLDEQKKREVEDVAKEVDALQVSIQQLTRGEGMSVVLLGEVIKSLRTSYEAKCRRVPGCVELTDEDLLKLRVDDNRTEDEIRAFLERDAAAQRDLANKLADPEANLTGIYFPPAVADEVTYDRKKNAPRYFNRGVYRKPLKGAKGVSATAPISGTVVAVLKALSDYAMCAYRYNNPNFSFQSYFMYTPGEAAAEQAAAAYMHRLIVSPLVTYCKQCDAHMWTSQYRLACFAHRMDAHQNYGTRDFWTVRSMVQAAPEVQNAALNYYEDRGLLQRRVLAVVLHLASERDRTECDRVSAREYGVHYQYLAANFPSDAALKMHVAENDDRRAQCAPTPAQIVEHIRRVRRTAAQDFDNIYLSVAAETRSNILALLKESGDMELHDRILAAPSLAEQEAKMPGFTELVDLEIASRATEILVSPFMSASQYVTEGFLLRHRLATGNKVWVF